MPPHPLAAGPPPCFFLWKHRSQLRSFRSSLLIGYGIPLLLIACSISWVTRTRRKGRRYNLRKSNAANERGG
jgi:hypothetical protein